VDRPLSKYEKVRLAFDFFTAIVFVLVIMSFSWAREIDNQVAINTESVNRVSDNTEYIRGRVDDLYDYFLGDNK